jgi:hypothetical protein
MKTRLISPAEPWGFNVIARFGRARLIELTDGRAELRNASPTEMTEAKEWISLFHHHTVLHVPPRS